MSKESFIGGDYIETTGGDNLNFAKGSITNSSLLQVAQNGKENGVSYNSPKKPENSNIEIEDLYWTYGEENKRIDSYSKHYVDLNLVVKVKNGKPGDFVTVSINFEDGDDLAEEVNELTLNGIVLEGNEIIFKKPLKHYTVIIADEN